MKYRSLGLFLLLLTAAIAYFEVYAPLHDAVLGLSVRLSMKGAVAIPILLIVGLGFVIGGEHFHALIHNDAETAKRYGKSSLWGWLFVIVGFAGGVCLYLWLKQHLAALGYVFSN